MKFSYKQRQQDIEKLQSTTYDVVVIGGGITGAGLALQAAASGLSTALIDMQDFSEGTSSRSTKLVHGGLRYLKQFDVEVVADTVSERAVVQQIAPHIPRAAKMLLPLYDEPEATFNLFRLGVAMNLYDSLAGVRESSPYANKVLTKEEVLQLQPNLLQEGLVGGGLYLDFTNNDSRLVIENVKQAVADGATAVSRMKVVGFNYDNQGHIVSANLEDQWTPGQTYEVKGKVFVNTTGPWSDTVRELDDQDHKGPQMRPTKGVHLVIDRAKLPVSQTIYFDSGEQDGRMIFVIPREDKTYFGTTDTDYTGDMAHPEVTQADVDYLLRIVNRRFPSADIHQSDIESSWAGLRPLIVGNNASDYNGGDNGAVSDQSIESVIQQVKAYLDGDADRQSVEKVIMSVESNRSESALDPSQVSRGSDLSASESGLLTLAGGKITDYRKMAAGAMQRIQEIFAKEGRKIRLVNSKTYPVSGGEFNPSQVDEAIKRFAQRGRIVGLSAEAARDIASLYGSNTERVLAYADQAKVYAKTYNCPVEMVISLLYALEEEAVYTLSDFLTRRTNYSLFKSTGLENHVEALAAIIQEALGLSDKQRQAQIEHYQKERQQMQLAHLD